MVGIGFASTASVIDLEARSQERLGEDAQLIEQLDGVLDTLGAERKRAIR